MATLRNDTVIRSADGQGTSAIVTASNIGSYGVATNATYYVGTTQNIFNRASGAQTLTGVSIDGNAATVTNGVYTTGTQTIGGAKTFSDGIIVNGATYFTFNKPTTTNYQTVALFGSASAGLFLTTDSAIIGVGAYYNAGWIATATSGRQIDFAGGNFTFGAFSGATVGGAANWGTVAQLSSAGVFSATGDFRAPIFYDSNDTNYYVDPAGTSRVNTLYVANVLADSASGNGRILLYGNLHIDAYGAYDIYCNYYSGKRFRTYKGAGTGAETFRADTDGLIYAFQEFRTPIIYDYDNTSYYIDSSSTSSINNLTVAGRIGVQISNPSYSLELYSGSKTSAYTGLSISNFNNYDGTAASLVTSQLRFAILESPIATYNSPARTFAILESGNEANNSSSDGFFAISTRSSGTVAQKFRITSTGNVGIGTSSPAGKFEIKSSAQNYTTAPAITFTDNTGVSDSRWILGNIATTFGAFNLAEAANASSTSYTSRITILSGGNVGIGATGPVTLLQISTGTPTASTSGIQFGDDTSARIFRSASGVIRSAGSLEAANGYVYASNYLQTGNNLIYPNGFSATQRLEVGNSANNAWVDGLTVAPGGIVTAYGDFRAPIFYDTDNTSYYIDPANTTLSLKTRSSIIINNASAPQNLAMLNIGYNGAGETRAIDIYGSWSGGENKSITFNHASGSANIVAQINAQHNGPASRLRFGKLYHGGDSSTYTMELVSESTTTAALYVFGSVRSPIFYDNDNTAYYIDAASSSNLNTLTLNGILTTVSSGTAINFSGQSDSIGYNATAGQGTYIKGTGTTYIYGGGVFYDGSAIRTLLHSNNYSGYSAFSGSVSSGGNITATGYIFTSTYLQTGGNLIYPSGYGATQRLEVSNSANTTWIDGITIAPGGIVTAPYEMRSPIFYDSNNTSYYIDPASTSNLVGLTVANTISGSINGTANGLNSSNYISRVGSSGNYNTDFQNTPAGTVRHLGDDSTATNNPGGAWWFVDNYRHSNSSNYWGTQVAWGWEDNANKLATRNITGGTFGSWVYYLNSGNYSNYAIARGGDTVDGVIYFRSNKGSTSTVGANNSYSLEAYSSDAGAAGMSFHRGGYYAVNMGLDPDNVLRIGGWSASANRLQLDMSGNLTLAGVVDATQFRDSSNTAYYIDPASTSNINALTVAGGNATIYRDLIVNGGASGNFGNRIIVQGTATTYTYQDATFRPTVYLNGDYPVVTLNCSATTNANHGPTLQFAFNGLTTGGTTSRQIVIGANGVGSWLDFGFSGGANGDNSSYNPHNGIAGYNGVTPMRLFSNGLLLGSTGAYPNNITSTSYALDVRGTGYSNTDFRAPIFYDSNNTAYYLDPNSASNLNNVTVAGTLTLSNIAKNSTAPIVINSGQSASLGLRVYYDMNLYNTLIFTDSAWNSQGSISGSSSVLTINAATATTSFVKYAGYSQEGGSFRAPIFYDSDNTAYYIDAASTSVFNAFTGSHSGGSVNVTSVNGSYLGVNNTTNTNGYGISLYNGASAGEPTYGLMFQGTATFGTHGSVTGDWSTYFTMNNDNTRGWIFRKVGIGNVASISAGGVVTATTFVGALTGTASGNLTAASSLTAGNLSGTIPSGVLGNSTLYIGTTAITLNRTSSSQTLTGTSIDGNAATVTNGAYLNAAQSFTAVCTFAVPSRTTSYTTPSLQVYTGDNTPPGIAFHRGGYSATYLYENDGELYTNPWTTRGQTGKLLAAGNYTDYTVTKTGTGASGTWGISITGNAATVTNGLYTNSSLTAGNLSGTIPSGVLGNSTHYIGTTAITLNRASASQTLTGISIDGNAATATNVNISNLATQQVSVSLAAGSWYTIAANDGNRASAKFTITDTSSGLHQAIHFYATAHYGTDSGAKISVISNTYYSGPPVSAIKIMRGSTYDGAMVQIYALSACNLTVSIYDNQQSSGWFIKSGVVSTTNPGTVANYAALTTVAAAVDLSAAKSFSVSDEIYIGGATTQYKALHANNYNSYAPTLTGTGASGTWSINVTGNAGGSSASCTGNSATTTLATKATRANGNFYIDDNYGNTVVGVYTSTRYQGVFAMGDSYKLPADGTTTGTLYGIGWSHPNAGGVAANLNTHGALIMENGTFLAALSGSIRCRDDMRSPLFYDSNNTAYYLDPASTSNLGGLTVVNTITGSVNGNAATATRTSSQSGYAHAGTGMVAFYNWGGTNQGTNPPDAGSYTTGISVGSNPGDQAYGFQIANNMWNTGLWTRNYNSTFGSWIRLLDSSNYNSYSPTLTGTGASGSWGINVTGSSASCSGNSATVTVNYNNDSNASYQMLWGSGNSVYGTAGVTLNPSTDYITATSFNASDWFRSSGNTGWYNGTWGGGIHMTDSTWVRVYNDKYFYCNTIIQAGSDMRSPRFYDGDNTAYYVDPASTSILNVVTANSYVQKSATQSLSGTVGCTIDVNAAGIHVLTLAASTTISSFTYNNRTSNPSVNTIMLVIKYGGTASITWTNVLWANGTTPSLTSASGYADVYMLTSYQGGAATPSWIGTVVAQALVSTSL